MAKENISLTQRLNLRRRLNFRTNPYSKIEDKHKFVFVHIPKTGGNGVLQSLFGVDGQGHKRLEDYYLYSSKRFNQYFKFAVVRHPFTRFVSAFYYLKGGGISKVDREVFRDQLLDGIEDVNDFVARLQSDPLFRLDMMNYIHFKPQSYFLEGLIRGKSLDYLGRQEDMDTAIRDIAAALNVDGVEIKVHNKTKVESSPLSDASKEFVYQLYRDDFELLGYTSD